MKTLFGSFALLFLFRLAAADVACPEIGEVSFPVDKYCNQYLLCVNGTLTQEECPNGLLYQGTHGAVYGHCAYEWKVHCDGYRPKPISSPGCPWQFGFFHEAGAPACVDFFSVCEWGIPERKPCHPPGLVYDERIKGCNWPDQAGCPGESVTGVSCPKDDKYNLFYPYPRYTYNDKTIVVCVNNSPRFIHCDEYSAVDERSLTCVDVKPRPKKVVKIIH